MHLRTKFELDNSKFAQLDNLEQIFEKFKTSIKLNTSNSFNKSQYQRSIDISYLGAV